MFLHHFILFISLIRLSSPVILVAIWNVFIAYRQLYQPVLCKQMKDIAQTSCILLAQVKQSTPVDGNVSEQGSSLTLILLQKKPSVKYHHHHNRKAISFTMCYNKNDSSCCQGELCGVCFTSFYKMENSSLHLLAFRPNLYSI